MKNGKSHGITNLSLGGLMVTLGIVYGDIGTSPLYVMEAIIASLNDFRTEYIYGAISCIIWTLTLQTTVKYILITIEADNKGVGGILALYAIMRKTRRWVFILAIIGAGALLADGIITPSITVTAAIEGLHFKYPSIPVIPVVLAIIAMLFISQQFGANTIGKSFGTIMFFWFLMIGTLGLISLMEHPQILHSFNPMYAIKLLKEYPGGFVLLGAVFLCTTGAEALYDDLGHCGKKNIRVSWIYVKSCLLLSYLGQGAWIISHPDMIHSINPFYAIMPSWFLLPGIIMATFAAIIASQALISGAFTLISEAIPLNFWPKVWISHPTDVKGQMYIPLVNWFLLIACSTFIIVFQKASNMQAAYGLAITVAMLMTTFMLSYYLKKKGVPMILIGLFFTTFLIIEGVFFIANLNKLWHGGWVSIAIASLMTFLMFIWYKGREIKKRFTKFIKLEHYASILRDLKNDETIPKYASNLVYMTRADYSTEIESKVIYSIINTRPKRADMYWIIHVHIVDEPDTKEFSVETLIPDVMTRVEFRLGFKVQPRINLYFRSVIQELVAKNEVDVISHYESLRKHNVLGDFRFIIIDRIITYDHEFKPFQKFILSVYEVIKNIGIGDVRAYGLNTSNVMVEKVPLVIKETIFEKTGLTRVAPDENYRHKFD